jgi:Holliday junction DNA helicase RuvA
MYDFLRGTVRTKLPTEVVLEAGGVGYKLAVPVSTSAALPPAGQEVMLLVHMHQRQDDAPRLFGFGSVDERRMFLLLLKVSGVGPAMGVQILSGATIPELVAAIREGDTKSLQRFKGIGKRLSERIVVELREAIDDLATADAPAGAADTPMADAQSALVSLGYSAHEAEKAVDRARKAVGADAGLEALIKAALGDA